MCPSIPILLAKADGVSRNLTGGELFRGDLHGHANRTGLEAAERAYRAFACPIPILYSGHRGSDFQELNRHPCLWEALGDTTEEHGLKASLLITGSYALSRQEGAEDAGC